MSSEHKTCDEKYKHCVPEPFLGRGVAEAEAVLLLGLAVDP